MYNISLLSGRAIVDGPTVNRSFFGNYLGNWFKIKWIPHGAFFFSIKLLFFVATTSLVNVQSTRMDEFLLVLFGSRTHLLLFPSQMGTKQGPRLTLKASGSGNLTRWGPCLLEVILCPCYLLLRARQLRPGDHPV